MMAGQLSPGRNWPLAPISKPVGVCIQLLTDNIQKAEMKVPTATAKVAAKCSPLPTLLMPKSMTPRKPDSRKKAVNTSYAIRGPTIGPAGSDRKRVVQETSVAVRVDLGGGRIM